MDVEQLELVARNLIAKANSRAIPLCLLGGIGVRMACAVALSEEPCLIRPVRDIDFASYSRHRTELTELLEEEGLQPCREFNTLYAAERQKFIYGDDAEQIEVDIILDTFKMCHIIPLGGRLGVGQLTLTPAELLLTKLQVVELTRNDALDIIAIILGNALKAKTTVCSAHTLDQNLIARLCGSDWGLFHTVTTNLQRIQLQILNELPLQEGSRLTAKDHIEKLVFDIRTMRKSIGWIFRSLIGPRVRWYDEPEEP